MKEENKEKFEILKKNLVTLSVNLDAINYSLSKYRDLSSFIIRSESINKIRRYGKVEYIKRFAADPNRNVSSFMRPVLYTEAMEKKLLEKKLEIIEEIKKAQFAIRMLENEKEDDERI